MSTQKVQAEKVHNSSLDLVWNTWFGALDDDSTVDRLKTTALNI